MQESESKEVHLARPPGQLNYDKFQPFLNLSNKLQDIIWDLAILPSCFRFDTGDVGPEAPTQPFWSHEPEEHCIKPAELSPLPSTAPTLLPGVRRTEPILFTYIPLYDSLRLHNINQLLDLAWGGTVDKVSMRTSDDKPSAKMTSDKKDSGERLNHIRSLLIDFSSRNFFYARREQGADVAIDTSICPHMPDRSPVNFVETLSYFPKLEELIFIGWSPKVEAKRAGNLRMNRDYVTSAELADCAARMEEFPRRLEAAIKH